jgi:hypothetical protein
MGESFNRRQEYGANYSWTPKAQGRRHSPEARAAFLETENRLIDKLKTGLSAIDRNVNKYGRLFATFALLASGGGLYHDREYVKNDLMIHDATRGAYEKVFRNKTEYELISKLDAEVGKNTVLQLERLESVTSEQERQKALTEVAEVKVQGFDKFKLPKKVFIDAVKTLPLGFRSKKQAHVVRYEDKQVTIEDSYGLSKTSQTAQPVSNIEVAHASQSPREIVFTKGAMFSDNKWLICETLAHEEAHENDPRTNKLLTMQERLQLLSDLADRVKSPDRFKSNYVEGINNPDKKVELANKVNEYWAEINAAYLSGNYFRLPQADRELVAGMIKKIDPKFDRKKSMKAREAIVKRYEKKVKTNPAMQSGTFTTGG